MASSNTPIEWTDRTWNPTRGCSRKSTECTNCYAEKVAARFGSKPGQPYFGLITMTPKGPTWNGKVALIESALEEPLHWKRPARVFVNSMSDLFHPNVPDAFIDKVFAVMARARQHTFQILTKHGVPARMREYMSAADRQQRIFAAGHEVPLCGLLAPAPWPLPNVWLGVSCGNQEFADERIPDLLATPAAVRFLSCEPLIGRVDLTRVRRFPGQGLDREFIDALGGRVWTDQTGLPKPDKSWAYPGRPFSNGGRGVDWVIVGGESGPKSRPMHPDFARDLRDQCLKAGVSFFFKQWGEWHTTAFSVSSGEAVFRQFESHEHWVNKAQTWVRGGICLDTRGREMKIGRDMAMARDEGTFPVTIMHKVGKKRAGRLLDGVEYSEFPK